MYFWIFSRICNLWIVIEYFSVKKFELEMNFEIGGGLPHLRRPNQPKLVKSLETIARNKYLQLLEDACAGYVKLLQIKTLMLKQVRDNILRTLKNQLEQNLTGILSSVVRQEMIGMVR